MNKFFNMKVFVEVVRSGSFAGAARALYMSPASVTMRINQLEDFYQKQLVVRTTRSLTLTTIGQTFYQDCVGLLDMLDSCEHKVKETDLHESTGKLRVASPIDFGKQYLSPAVNMFCELYPKVRVDMQLSDTYIDLLHEYCDFAIRFGKSHELDVINQRIADSQRMLCASPNYLARYGMPKHPHDLSGHACISLQFGNRCHNNWNFAHPIKRNLCVNVQPAISTNNGELVRVWAKKGCGIAVKSFLDIKNDLANGTLVAVFCDTNDFHYHELVDTNVYLTYAKTQYRHALQVTFQQFFADYMLKSLQKN